MTCVGPDYRAREARLLRIVTLTCVLQDAVAHYLNVCRSSDVIIAHASLDDLCVVQDRDPPVNLRWVLTHLLEETARHAGHADIIREMIDGAVGR